MLVSGVQQIDSVVHTHIFILFHIRFPFRLLQNIEQSSLCCTVDPGWLFILNTVVCIWEKAMAPHSSTLAWKIPWMEELGRLQFIAKSRT